MKVEKSLERLEVRLRANVAEENELIQALSEQEGTYGGMNELMRQCVVRGFMVLKQKMQSVSGSADEVGVIDALAQAIIGGEYGYRVINTYLYARQQIAQAAGAASSTPAAPVSLQPAPQPALDNGAAQAALAAVAADVLIGSSATQLQVEENLPGAALSLQVAPAVEHEPQQQALEHKAPDKPKHSWARLRDVAGSTGGDKGPGAAE